MGDTNKSFEISYEKLVEKNKVNTGESRTGCEKLRHKVVGNIYKWWKLEGKSSGKQGQGRYTK